MTSTDALVAEDGLTTSQSLDGPTSEANHPVSVPGQFMPSATAWDMQCTVQALAVCTVPQQKPAVSSKHSFLRAAMHSLHSA